MLSELLRENPPYTEDLAERVLREYCRIHAPAVRYLSSRLGEEDVVQTLRIHLWQQWVRWDGRVSLQRWLSWRMRHKVKSMMRDVQRHRVCSYSLDIAHEE